VREGLAAGAPVRLASTRTIADALAPPFAGERNLEIIRRLVEEVVVVSDTEIVAAMRFVWERARLIVEPGGAAAVAALLADADATREGERVVAILSGGNVDIARAAELFASA
jgi:threonine dehydratase